VDNVRFVPNGEDQAYLSEHYGLRPYTERHKRQLIKQNRYPKPVQISPGRLAFTTVQLDQYAQKLLSQVSGQTSDAA
jgi:hypothetical protein